MKPDRRTTLELNRRQKAYYESRFAAAGGREREANRLTHLWTRLRRRIQAHDADVGVREAVLEDHRRWLGDLSGCRVLDLGCFAGNDLSLWIARHCAEYQGMDLSESAIAQLQARLDAEAPGATARAGDFLANDFPDAHFDVIYAHSVLHHFADIRLVLEEMHRILRPGGIIVSIDPLATEPFNRLARLAYRPFQSDRDWEWPFTWKTFRHIRQYFGIDRVQGYRGFSMLAFPLALLPPARGLALRLAHAGRRLEHRLASREGPALWICWLIAMRLEKPRD